MHGISVKSPPDDGWVAANLVRRQFELFIKMYDCVTRVADYTNRLQNQVKMT